MIRYIRKIALLFAGATTFVAGGCVTNAQLQDFFRTEVARIVSDVFGQQVFNALRAGSTNFQ